MKITKFILSIVVTSCISFQTFSQFNSNHDCATWASSSTDCQNLKKLKDYRVRNETKYTMIPHRGYWQPNATLGTNLYPENSESAIRAAKDFFASVEVDIMLTKDDNPVALHDYSVSRLLDGFSSSDRIWDLNWAQVKNKKLKYTNGTVSNDVLVHFVNLLDYAKASNLIVFVDIKEGQKGNMNCADINECKKEFWDVMRKCFVIAESKGQLRRVVFKIPFKQVTANEIATIFSGTIYGYQFKDNDKYRVLYMPVYYENDKREPEDYATSLELFKNLYPNCVFGAEFNMKNGNSQFAQSFYYKGRNFPNMFDFMYYYLLMRPSFFSTEPLRTVNGKGQTVSRYSQWNDISSTDVSGDLYQMKNIIVSSYAYGSTIITTDQPNGSRFPGPGSTNRMSSSESSIAEQPFLEEDTFEKNMVYPNPVTNSLWVQLSADSEIGWIEIYDLKGQRIDTPDWKGKAVEGRFELFDLNDILEQGVYVIKFYGLEGNTLLEKRLIKN
ncbi:MAG: glycerophosphodiester phosphodiesterase family protein [Bacteroidota bacterium]